MLIVASHSLSPSIAAPVVNKPNSGGKTAGGGKGTDSTLQVFSRKFKLKTRVFNAFPVSNVTAFVAFEEDRVRRLQYGALSVLNATLEPHSDFIIQFRRAPRDCEKH